MVGLKTYAQHKFLTSFFQATKWKEVDKIKSHFVEEYNQQYSSKEPLDFEVIKKEVYLTHTEDEDLFSTWNSTFKKVDSKFTKVPKDFVTWISSLKSSKDTEATEVLQFTKDSVSQNEADPSVQLFKTDFFKSFPSQQNYGKFKTYAQNKFLTFSFQDLSFVMPPMG